VPIYRKANPGDPGESGGWIRLKNIYRKADPGDPGESGGWIKLKSVWRFLGGSSWERVFGILCPYSTGSENVPKFYFIHVYSKQKPRRR
jgi:hypothetical protein